MSRGNGHIRRAMFLVLLAWAIPALAGHEAPPGHPAPDADLWVGPEARGLGVLRLDQLDTIIPGERTFLEPNVPNPFSQRTRISFSLATEGAVTLRIYDFWYREVATLVDEQRRPGRYHAFFDVSLIDPVPASGMYFFELKTAGETMQRRMLLIK